MYMAYFLCAIISVFMFAYIETNQFKCVSAQYKFSINKSVVYSVLIVLLLYWTLLLGLQYEVGADYNSYIDIFSKLLRVDTYRTQKEYFFYYIAYFIVNNHIPPQLGFVVIAFIQCLFFFIFIRKLGLKYNFIFIFLYFFVCTAFYNQTNGIRQFVSANIFLVAVYYAYKKNIAFYMLSIILAAMFHRSAWFLMPFYFIFNISYNKTVLFIFLSVSIVISLISLDSLLESLYNLAGIKMYARYFNSSFRDYHFSLINKLTKYIYIPFYFLSLLSYNKLSNKDRWFYNAGFLSYCLKLIALSSFFIFRFALLFEIFLIFPLYYFVLYLIKRKNSGYCFNLILLFLFIATGFGLLCAKLLVFPTAEYKYQSIFSLFF